MPSSSLTVTINDPHTIDGWAEAAIRNNTTPEELAAEFLTNQGKSYANLFGIGVITSAAFMARFTPTEYANIMAAAQQSPEIASYITELVSHATVPLYDPRMRSAAEALAAIGLIQPERVDELLRYERPGVEVIKPPAYIEPALDDNDTSQEPEVTE